MTLTITEPTIDVPVEIVDAQTCTAAYAWCNGECHEDDPYHYGAVAWLSMQHFTPRGWVESDDASVLLRHDENEGDASTPLVMVDGAITLSHGMTASQARQNAAWLLNAADLLDPLPAGVMATTAVKVHIGDELLTEDGWQKVTGLLFMADSEQASIFTPERNDEDTDGWDLSFNDPVKVRRPLTGSCAIQFIEPMPGGTK
jgi:hypothetical protein